jgi:hypothetical protein
MWPFEGGRTIAMGAASCKTASRPEFGRFCGDLAVPAASVA